MKSNLRLRYYILPSIPSSVYLQSIEVFHASAFLYLRGHCFEQDYQIKWSRDRSGLPRRSEIFGNTLRLISVTLADIDRYTCEVHSPHGTSSDFIDLFVDRT